LLRPFGEIDSHCLESELRFSLKHSGPFAILVNYSVLEGFDTPFVAPLTLVC
jgi:hypothetical protein